MLPISIGLQRVPHSLGTYLDCYWVGSLDFNILGNQVGFSTKPPKKSFTFCLGGLASNQASLC